MYIQLYNIYSVSKITSNLYFCLAIQIRLQIH